MARGAGTIGARELLPVALITALAATLRFATLGEQSIWFDEYFSVTDSRLSFGAMLEQVRTVEINPPLYYVAAWVWVHAFGESDAAIRSLSALAGTATVPVAYLAGRELATPRAGVLLAAFVATNPFLIWYSQEARTYMLMVLLTAVSFYFFARCLRRPGRWAVVGWAVASGAAIATHYYAGALVAPEAAWLLARAPSIRRQVMAGTAGVAVVIAALLPIVLPQSSRAGWISEIDPGGRLRQLPELFAVGNSAPGPWAGLLVAAAAAAAVWLLITRGNARERSGAGIAAAMAAGGLAVCGVGMLTGNDFVIARNLIALWLPLAAAVAIGLAVSRSRAGLVAAVVICATSTALAVEVSTDKSIQRVDWSAAAELIDEPPDDRIVVARGGYLAWPLLHYLDGAARISPNLAPVREYVAVDYESSRRGRICWWGGSCAMPDPPLDPLPVPPGFELAGTTAGARFTVRRYRSAMPRRVRVELPEATFWLQQHP